MQYHGLLRGGPGRGEIRGPGRFPDRARDEVRDPRLVLHYQDPHRPSSLAMAEPSGTRLNSKAGVDRGPAAPGDETMTGPGRAQRAGERGYIVGHAPAAGSRQPPGAPPGRYLARDLGGNAPAHRRDRRRHPAHRIRALHHRVEAGERDRAPPLPRRLGGRVCPVSPDPRVSATEAGDEPGRLSADLPGGVRAPPVGPAGRARLCPAAPGVPGEGRTRPTSRRPSAWAPRPHRPAGRHGMVHGRERAHRPHGRQPVSAGRSPGPGPDHLRGHRLDRGGPAGPAGARDPGSEQPAAPSLGLRGSWPWSS